jgi:hypothetical protein
MAKTDLGPIRSKRDYEAALKEVERLWGAKAGTRHGDRLDVLATLFDAYEAEHYPMDPPDPVEAINSGRIARPTRFAAGCEGRKKAPNLRPGSGRHEGRKGLCNSPSVPVEAPH